MSAESVGNPALWPLNLPTFSPRSSEQPEICKIFQTSEKIFFILHRNCVRSDHLLTWNLFAKIFPIIRPWRVVHRWRNPVPAYLHHSSLSLGQTGLDWSPCCWLSNVPNLPLPSSTPIPPPPLPLHPPSILLLMQLFNCNLLSLALTSS